MSVQPGMTIVQVAFEVGTALAEEGVVAVLSGGGAATLYAPEAYQTQDLDFVLQSFRAKVDSLFRIGFRRYAGSGMYEHPDVPFTLEFPAGPLAVGDEVLDNWETLREHEKQLNVISPTDCVRDRLAAAIHWRDEASIRQAVAVARRHPIGLEKVEAWCAAEGGARTFEAFVAQMDKPQRSESS